VGAVGPHEDGGGVVGVGVFALVRLAVGVAATGRRQREDRNRLPFADEHEVRGTNAADRAHRSALERPAVAAERLLDVAGEDREAEVFFEAAADRGEVLARQLGVCGMVRVFAAALVAFEHSLRDGSGHGGA
jgi:hypothetical protein